MSTPERAPATGEQTPATGEQTPATGEQLARAWFEHAPMIGLLGLRLVAIGEDEATVELPFRESLATAGDVVHGGAIMSLIDTAAALAAWSRHDPAEGVRWGTVGVSVSFLSAARGADLSARAQVSRRGRAISFCRVEVLDGDGGRVAEGLVSYRLG